MELLVFRECLSVNGLLIVEVVIFNIFDNLDLFLFGIFLGYFLDFKFGLEISLKLGRLKEFIVYIRWLLLVI